MCGFSLYGFKAVCGFSLSRNGSIACLVSPLLIPFCPFDADFSVLMHLTLAHVDTHLCAKTGNFHVGMDVGRENGGGIEGEGQHELSKVITVVEAPGPLLGLVDAMAPETSNPGRRLQMGQKHSRAALGASQKMGSQWHCCRCQPWADGFFL